MKSVIDYTKDIPVHQLTDRVSTGFEIMHFKPGDLPKKDDRVMGAHRDDHYLFFLLEEGSASTMVDFEEMRMHGNSLFYILPGQVHHRISNSMASGWYLAVDTLMIAPVYRSIFEDNLVLQKPHNLSPGQSAQMVTILGVLEEKYFEDSDSTFYMPVVHSLLKAFIGMFACYYNGRDDKQISLSRPAQLAQQFKKLLATNMRTQKSPSGYASMLNVSESYLNEALKKTTGFSVTYWIINEVVLEAKRLLYYSQLNVKEIAHSLGYEDHTYFSRLFKKSVAITPLAFRELYRK